MLRANLNDILVFLSTVKAGSFVGGGEAMGLTRSAAGKAVSRLEERLGVRLLTRTTRTLSLTDEGRTFHERGLQIVGAIEDAEASVAQDGGKARGVLRLTAPDAFGRLILLPLVRQYLEDWPEMQVEISFSDRVADLLEEGFDLAVRIGVADPDSQQVSRVVAKYRSLLCAAPDYLDRHGVPSSIDALSAHDCLIFSSRLQRQSWRLRSGDEPWVKISGHSRLRLDSGEAIRDAAVAGLGIGLLPEFLVAQYLAAGRLRQVLPHVETEAVKIVTIYPTKRFLEPRVRHFIDLLAAKLPD